MANSKAPVPAPACTRFLSGGAVEHDQPLLSSLLPPLRSLPRRAIPSAAFLSLSQSSYLEFHSRLYSGSSNNSGNVARCEPYVASKSPPGNSGQRGRKTRRKRCPLQRQCLVIASFGWVAVRHCKHPRCCVFLFFIFACTSTIGT